MASPKTQSENNLQEVVVYHLVDINFEIANMYAIGGVGLRPNARYIAQQHGCHLEFRESQLRKTGHTSPSPSYWERRGIGRDNSCISAVLVGEDKKQLIRARDEIRRIFRVSRIKGGDINVGHEKTFFSQ